MSASPHAAESGYVQICFMMPPCIGLAFLDLIHFPAAPSAKPDSRFGEEFVGWPRSAVAWERPRTARIGDVDCVPFAVAAGGLARLARTGRSHAIFEPSRRQPRLPARRLNIHRRRTPRDAIIDPDGAFRGRP